MGRVSNENSRRLVDELVNDPQFLIFEDGRVFRQTGLPDNHGTTRIARAMKVNGVEKHVSCNVKEIVWTNFNGPIPKDKRVIQVDGDHLNNALSNLALYDLGNAYRPRSWKSLTIENLLAIKEEFDGTNAPQLALKYNVASTEISKIAKSKLEV